MNITLSWPPRILSPNGRGHWRAIAAAKKVAKNEAWALTAASGATAPAKGPIPIAITFHPKTRNRPDVDNLIASCKAALDGIALALGCDDSRFQLAAPVIAEPVKGGKVVVTIGGAQ